MESREKILKKLREDSEIKDIVSGDYLGFFKRIGSNKSVAKVMNVKPDYFAQYSDLSYDCIFFQKSAFSCFEILAKLAVLKKIGCEFDFKRAVFYCNDSKLLNSKSLGIINEESSSMASHEMPAILEFVDYFKGIIGKKIDIFFIGNV